MDPGRWERVQAVFHEAAARAGDDRSAYLERSCSGDDALREEVESLLAADARGSSLLDGGGAGAADAVLGPAGLPRALGPYRITGILGEGGMGVVYRAERRDLGRAVALKVLRDAWVSSRRRERFQEEQRTLAALDHPSIAHLYDADVLPDGTPWFAMELVEGEPITVSCHRRGLALRERLQLFHAACEAVAFAQRHAVVHRDIKPSNVLVRADGTVKLIDFGIAKHLDPTGPEADATRTGMRLMTPAYAAPEQLRAEPPGLATDVWALGVLLHELLTTVRPFDGPGLSPAEVDRRILEADPERPSAAARRAPAGAGAVTATAAEWADLDLLCATALRKEAWRRYGSAEALLRDLDRLLRCEPLEARRDSPRDRLRKYLRRHRRGLGTSAAALAVVGGLAFAVGRQAGVRPGGSPPADGPRERAVAVLPFQNPDRDPGLDHLRLALPDEIASALASSRSLVVRPVEATRRFAEADLDPRKVGAELGVDALVTGRFSGGPEGLRVALSLVDAASNRLLWQENFQVPLPGSLALKERLVAATRGGLSGALGVSAAPARSIPRPTSAEAYDLYLRSAALRYDPGPNARGLAMMERAVALDPGYGPAWLALARRCYVEARYNGGDPRLIERYVEGIRRALALDPESIVAAAWLAAWHVERGELVRAYRMGKEMVGRRPDSADAHFWLGYALRYAGLLDEAARECETALAIDPYNFGWRSCAYVALWRGDPGGARAWLALDAGSEFTKALTVHLLAWEGRDEEALRVDRPHMPGWKSLDLLRACLERRPAAEIAALVRSVQPVGDAETNYLAAEHLARCGQSEAALAMLRRAVEGGYCAVGALESDRLLDSLRPMPGFAPIRAAAAACRERFLAERDPR